MCSMPCSASGKAQTARRSLALPVLVVWGERDAWLPLEVSERIAQLIPGAERAVLEGAGHFSMEDRPQAVAEALRDFLQKR
jgi:pimeloyl-ACP methyl ester carboxylesterase